MPRDLPLSVWPTAQQSPRAQRSGRYVATSNHHPARMLPAIARTAIEAYTQPGDLVVDPMCGVGTTLVEATHLGRDAIGIEYEPRWADLARANTDHARTQGAIGHADVVVGDARRLTHAIDPAAHGLVALVLTSPPYGPSTHGHVRTSQTEPLATAHDRYSRDRNNLAHRNLDELLEAMEQVFTGCSRVLRPGGIVAMTVRPWWHKGELIDLPGELGRAGERAGLVLYERNVALLAGLRDNHLVPRPSFFALNQIRRARAAGTPRAVIAHEDLLVFRGG